jgi:hypothetical protein
MAYEPRLIAPFEGGGLVTYYKPWLIGFEAFPILEDAYLWRGSCRKREGFSLLAVLPTTPVQGLKVYYTTTGNQQLVGFSTTKAYLLISVPNIMWSDISFFQTTGAPISWTGGNDDFFWTTNFASSLWVTNNVDPLRFWNGSTTQGWNNQRPIVNGTTRMTACLLIIAHKGRLIALNTTEGGSTFTNRARWSQIGTPYVLASGGDPAVVPPTPFAIDDNAWRDDIPGKGGFIDADTNEQIVSCAIVRDVLIVFFQRSTWRLRYTGNEILPFIWERLNTQYGSESPLSSISFDEGILSFSRYGFIEADTNSVDRIDLKIPDQSFFNMRFGTTLNSLRRVQGIRDYYRATAYWCYEDVDTNTGINNRVLAYNYLDKTWAIFKQPFRCFGYYKQFNDLQWQNATFAWETANQPWSGPEQSQFPQVVAGDADPTSGNVYVTYETINDADDNGTNFGFDIWTKKFNPYIQQGLRCRLQYVDIYTTRTATGEITLNLYIDDETDTPQMTRKVNISVSTRGEKYERVFLGAIGRFFQIELTLTDAQIADDDTGKEQFELQGMVIWTRPEGRVKQ